MNYIRLCKGIQDKGKLIPITENVYAGIDLSKDYYTSAFLYNDKHFKIYKDTGTVAGITDTVTNKLYWDFDSEKDLNQAKQDASALCDRLINTYKFDPSEVSLFFSGRKGFQVEINYKKETFNPSEVKNICLNIGEGLPTLDRQIYNASRILRLPLSKHEKSGLYKIPLDPTSLSEIGVTDIQEEAKNPFAVEDLDGAYNLVNNLSQTVLKLKTSAPKIEEKKVASVAYDISEVDWTVKPKFLTPEKYLLSLGFFESGERSHALMILGSTFKSLGFNETQTYHVLKSTAELQAERTGDDKFPKKEIYANIISQIYAPTWKGGIYSVANDDLLQQLSLLVPPAARTEDDSDVHTIKETGELFTQYAKDIDKNTLKFGISCLDENLHVQVGRLYGIIGPPGVGKTSVGISILNFSSLQKEHSMFFSFDMSKYDTYQKLIQKHTRKDRNALYDLFKSGSREEVGKVMDTVTDNYENVHFVFKTGQSIEEMKQTILSVEKKLGITLRLIVVDYLELVQSKFSDPTQASAEIIQGLREIAINMNKAVVVFLQPNKMSSTIDEPLLSYNSAKGSSSIAQACTAILTLHRPGYSSRTPETDRYFSIDCVKNRSGKLFSADLFWDGLTGNIRELEEVEADELKELRERKKAARNESDSNLF
jgi:KaiC/GvpD/RAD55 family RecA-like ATPase